ncbi:MAG TPA: hypothetical protein VFX98_09060, partial [Longimicrobiaceae bacterium]|nr:hypothetical protein [Longimicrobiaceae bacterium]
MHLRRICIPGLVLLWGCSSTDEARDAEAAQTAAAQTAATTPASSSTPAPAANLDAGRAKEIGLVFESYLSPWQEGDEEENTPRSTPAQFRSSTPSQTRAQREAAGHRGH